MKTSASIAAIAKALPQAQRAIKAAKKDVKNDFFKSKYADLASVIDACKEALNANGICFLQGVRTTEDGIVVETMLLHESGEWFSEELALPVVKHDPQGIGSAISYGKRYGLQAMVGVPSEDDDANAASKTAVKDEARTDVIGKGPSDSQIAFESFPSAEQRLIEAEAHKLIEASKNMQTADLGAFYTLQNYDSDTKLAINYCLQEHAPIRRKIKDGAELHRMNVKAAEIAQASAKAKFTPAELATQP